MVKSVIAGIVGYSINVVPAHYGGVSRLSPVEASVIYPVRVAPLFDFSLSLCCLCCAWVTENTVISSNKVSTIFFMDLNKVNLIISKKREIITLPEEPSDCEPDDPQREP